MRTNRRGWLIVSLFLLALVSTNAGASPVSLWKLDEGSGTIAHDSAGSNHGTLINGTNWGPRVGGNCVEFDGINDYVEVPDDNSLDFAAGQNVSIAFWFRVDRPIDTFAQDLLNKRENTSDQIGWRVYYESRSTMYYYRKIIIEIDKGQGAAIITSNTFVDDGLWHHLVVVRQGINYGLYLDGTLRAAYDMPSGWDVAWVNSAPLRFGTDESLTGFFDGGIDEVAIYNRALSSGEVAQLYYGSKNACDPSPGDGTAGVALRTTALHWTPYSEATGQEVFFGTVSGSLLSVASGDGNLNSVSNAQIGGPLDFNETYYWRVDTDGKTGDEWNFSTYSTYWLRVPGQYSTIQAAIDASAAGDMVVVWPGTYYENINFNGKNITVTSINPDNPAGTIINGGGNGVTVTFSNGSTSELVGFTITGGTDNNRTFGGGVCCYASKPIIKNCIISNNSNYFGGGGLCCEESSPILTNCTLSGNSAKYFGGGIYLRDGSSPTLINCKISDNSVTSSSEESIGGGGMRVSQSCRPTLINCTFSNNTVNRGNGGGIYISPASAYLMINPTLINCTFYGNTVSNGSGGAIYCDDSIIAHGGTNSSSSTLTNCIVWGNSLPQMYGSASVSYSDIQEGWAGEGNISVNPMFVNPSTGDYHLQSGSPCRNAGNPNFVPEPGVMDIDGEPRIMGAAVDIGVDEYTENIRPVADAGPDQSFSATPPFVTLDGGGSFDADSDPLSYHWQQIYGPVVEINDANSAITTFSMTTFSPAEYGAYIFKLVVNDGSLDSFADSVNIVVGSGRVPVADAGSSRYAGTDSVQLDGTGSYDPDASGSLSYQWQQISGPSVTITGADTATPTISGFTPTDSIQRCEFELVVSDGRYSSLPDVVEVMIVHDGYLTRHLRFDSGTFDPEKPTFIFFGRGGPWLSGSVSSAWRSKANIMSEAKDSFGLQTDYRYNGDYIITYLSKVAPNYKYPIQFLGVSGGVTTGMMTAAYLNKTYSDHRYAVNHMTFSDYDYYWCVKHDFLTNPVDGEQCWLDTYMDEMARGWPINSALNVDMIGFTHGASILWYRNSLTYPDMNQFNGGVIAGAYWSVIGPGKNLQLVSTPDAITYYFQWYGKDWYGYMDFYNQSSYPGRLPQPVTLVGPENGAVIDANGAVFSCEVSENAVGYQLLFGSDPYRVMDYNIISDTPNPPNEMIAELPFQQTWWTVRAYDQFGSTIYADPRLINLPENIQPVADAGPDRTIYVWFDSEASIVLDGSNSSDPDGDTLTYTWAWTIDANMYEASGVSPTIELPVGVHTIQLVVNDGYADSAADDVNVTVVAPLEGTLKITPTTINRKSNQPDIRASIKLPGNIAKNDVDLSEPLVLYPGGIKATSQKVLPAGNSSQELNEVVASFEKAALMNAVLADGNKELKVAGKLKSGQYFYGCDTVKVIK